MDIRILFQKVLVYFVAKITPNILQCLMHDRLYECVHDHQQPGCMTISYYVTFLCHTALIKSQTVPFPYGIWHSSSFINQNYHLDLNSIKISTEQKLHLILNIIPGT